MPKPTTIRAGTVVRSYRGGKGIVVGIAPADSFSRAYGKQAYVCSVHGKQAFVGTEGVGDLRPIGKAKRVPVVCKRALEEYEEMYPSLARKRKRK